MTRDAEVCHVTVTGRRTGRAYRVELWFLLLGPAEQPGKVILLAGHGERADWVRNVRCTPVVLLELPGRAAAPFRAEVGPFPYEQAWREAMDAKHHAWTPGTPLSAWAQDSLVVRLSPVAQLS